MGIWRGWWLAVLLSLFLCGCYVTADLGDSRAMRTRWTMSVHAAEPEAGVVEFVLMEGDSAILRQEVRANDLVVVRVEKLRSGDCDIQLLVNGVVKQGRNRKLEVRWLRGRGAGRHMWWRLGWMSRWFGNLF